MQNTSIYMNSNLVPQIAVQHWVDLTFLNFILFFEFPIILQIPHNLGSQIIRNLLLLEKFVDVFHPLLVLRGESVILAYHSWNFINDVRIETSCDQHVHHSDNPFACGAWCNVSIADCHHRCDSPVNAGYVLLTYWQILDVVDLNPCIMMFRCLRLAHNPK